MGQSFLSAYIELAENEKDPRNLLITFAIARVILIEFDISEHVEVGSSIHVRIHRIYPFDQFFYSGIL